MMPGKRTLGVLLALLFTSLFVFGAGKKTKPPETTKATPPQASLRAYIEKVRAQQAAEVRTPGSIWSPNGQLVRLGTDVKAFRVHDVVQIVVTESLAASTDGQVKNARARTPVPGLRRSLGR